MDREQRTIKAIAEAIARGECPPRTTPREWTNFEKQAKAVFYDLVLTVQLHDDDDESPAKVNVGLHPAIREGVEAAFEGRDGWQTKIAAAARHLPTEDAKVGGDEREAFKTWKRTIPPCHAEEMVFLRQGFTAGWDLGRAALSADGDMQLFFDRQQAGFERCYEALGITDDRERSWSALVLAITDALSADGAHVQSAVIAGALFDFMGHLTSRDEVLTLSATHLATPAVDALAEWAKKRGLSLDGARVEDWQAALSADGGEDSKLFDWLRDETCDLRAINVPTGGDDFDVRWVVEEHQMSCPRSREIGRSFTDDPRDAIRAAIAAKAKGDEQ